MDVNVLWSLRLGFSAGQAEAIKAKGIKAFLENSFTTVQDSKLPDFMETEPRNYDELKARMKQAEAENRIKEYKEDVRKARFTLSGWWVDKMQFAQYPLREKMVVFWHNHYVSEMRRVNLNYWIYTQNQVLRQNAFGNFRELTKSVIKTNAMIKYLDNDKNIKGKYNENLSRELLELFTLGEGNYTETDIKNGAKGLAGLGIGPEGGILKDKRVHDTPFEYFVKTGNFKSDELVDIIFEQQSAPYLITKKILKWFIYDNPPSELVKYYGDYLRQQDYEIKPLLLKMFTEEFNKPTAGSKIKDPLVFMLQLLNELNIKQNSKLVAYFTRNHFMELFNPPNVKGWEGGNSWLTAQMLMQRNNIADKLCKGQNPDIKMLKYISDDTYNVEKFDVKLEWNKAGNNKDIIAQLSDRLIFKTDPNLQKDFEALLKYDFDPNVQSADNAVLRLFNYMIKTPEFQLI
jgi:uncharacterized protein (DUF1800 family)